MSAFKRWLLSRLGHSTTCFSEQAVQVILDNMECDLRNEEFRRSWDTVARLVEAAGGRVTVARSSILEEAPRMWEQHDMLHDTYIYSTRPMSGEESGK